MNSYLTADELLNFYPPTSQYEPEQITLALTTSFSLVNSFLDSTVPTPVTTVPVPGILQIVQSRFAQYVLEHTNNGWSQELQNLFDSTIVMCKGLSSQELLISEISTTNQELGWNLTDSTLTIGKVFVDGTAPDVETEYTFTMTVSGTQYVADTEWDVTRSDSATTLYTIAGSYDWQDVGDGYLQIRFDGQFIGGETFKVTGIPETLDVVSTQPIIKQSTIYY